jgi:prepilin-type processing-associated H-X9-DG protein
VDSSPVTVDVERERGVTITWADGHVSPFDLESLRVSCQCAECRGLREAGGVAWPGAGAPRPLRIETAAQVGNWGLNLHWNDGHTTGIYTWELLRAWCPCPICDASGDPAGVGGVGADRH